MFERELKFGKEAQDKVLEGIKTLYEAVGSTLGPRGKFFLHQPVYGPPHPTKDGVTVAKNILLSDNFLQVPVDVVKEAALKTCAQAGDGTTTSIVLAYHLIANAFDLMQCDKEPLDAYVINKVYKQLCDEVIGTIKSNSLAIDLDSDLLLQVARVSTNHDEDLAQAIIDTYKAAGKHANITLGYSTSGKNESDVSHGFTLDQGYISPYFINDVKNKRCVWENAYILVLPQVLHTCKDFTRLFNEVIDSNRPLIMIVEDAEGEGLAKPIKNFTDPEGRLKVAMVRIPFADPELKKEMVQDICLVTGAKILSGDLGMNMVNIGISHMGTANKVIIDQNNTLIVGGGGDSERIQERAEQIEEILKSDDLSESLRAHYLKTLSMLHGSIGVLRVGGATQSEASERYFRAEDAINAVKSALEEGINVGGGQTLAVLGLSLARKFADEINTIYQEIAAYKEDQAAKLADIDADEEDAEFDEPDSEDEVIAVIGKALNSVSERRVGVSFCNALKSPFERILTNGDFAMDKIVEILAKIHDALPDKQIVYEIKKDGGLVLTSEYINIVDPTKVLRCALENAVSVTAMILNTHTLSASPLSPDALSRNVQSATTNYHRRYMQNV